MSKKTIGKLSNDKTKGDAKQVEPLSDAGDVLESMRKDPQVAKTIGKLRKAVKADTIGNGLEPDAMYFFDIKRGDSQHVYMWKRFHGKCFDAASEPLKTIGYLLIQTGFRKVDEKDYSRTTCEHCGEQLNKALAKQLASESVERLAKRKRLAEFKAKKLLEQQKELVLLGVM